MSIIQNLEWRYATKKFDPTKIIDDNQINILKSSIRLSPSSYGLQLYKILDVRDKESRAQLKSASWGQSQVTDASHFFVFCNYTKYDETAVDNFVRLKAEKLGKSESQLTEYSAFMKSKLSVKSDADFENWTARQCYIALGNLLTACAELKIDACPMEGFEPETYDKILHLGGDGLAPAVAVAVGYRAEDDASQHAAKVRRDDDDLFVKV